MDKKGKGRQKIPMKKIENKSHLQVTFSRRRDGVFKKASELGILCDANAAFIIFSPSNKVYSFGNPSVGMVLDKYHANTNVDSNMTDLMMRHSQNIRLQELIREINNVEDNLSMQKAIGEQLKGLKKAKEGDYWWDGPKRDKLTPEQIDILKGKMEKAYHDVQTAKHKLRFEANNNVEEPIANASTFIGQYDGTGHAHTQEIASFDPVNPDQSTGFVLPHEYKLDNEFNFEIPNSFNNLPLVGGSHPLQTTTLEINPTTPFNPSVNDGVGPSGTKNCYSSTSGYNRGYH